MFRLPGLLYTTLALFAIFSWGDLSITLALTSNSVYPDYLIPRNHHNHYHHHHHHHHHGCEHRKEMAANRKCLKRCSSDRNCRGRSRKCVCDDVCGMSCVKLSQKCETVKLLFNGKFEIVPFNIFGASVRYSCNTGFDMIGPSERICQGDGYWSGDPPVCQPDFQPAPNMPGVGMCSEPPDIMHAIHDGDSKSRPYLVGSQLTYSCLNGFRDEGGFGATCVGEGRWVGPTMTCQPEHCGHPGDALNARREGNIFVYPNKVKYSCNEGYELIGRATLICQADGKWSSSLPSCKPIPCPKLLPPINGIIIGSDFSFEGIIKFSCQKGFILEGSVTRKCQSNGKWSERSPICTIVDCGRPGPFYNGYFDGQKTTYGSNITFRCFGRTNFDGVSVITTCLENGSWSHPIPKCWNKCEIPKIDNGSLENGLTSGEYLSHKSHLLYRCDSGFTNKSKDGPSECFNGTWTRKPICHPAPCNRRPPEIKDGIVRFHAFNHGSRAKYMCNTGFKIKGITFLTCSHGIWAGKTPICEEVHCKYPGAMSNGQILLVGIIGKYDYSPYARRIGHNQQIEYQCGKDFVLIGPSAATCVDGEWSPPNKPECLAKQHPKLTIKGYKG